MQGENVGEVVGLGLKERKRKGYEGARTKYYTDIER